jgi:NADH-quinone oxidoreductase subunit I
MKCVACFMCATACPAECIHIEATQAPEDWDGRDKIPAVFEIDMLRCIYCGFCVEACPKDAIIMTNKTPVVHDNRKDFVYDMQKLLNN